MALQSWVILMLNQQLVQYSVFKKISEYFKQRNDSLPVTVSKEASVSKDKKLQKLPLVYLNI